MKTEPDHIQEIDFEPSLGNRILWWFGIYFAAQLPLIKYIAGFYLFPFGLAVYYRFLISSGDGQNQGWMLFPYALYVIHLVLSLCWPNPKAFRILMIILVVIVVLNLVGCEMMFRNLSNIH